MGVYVCVVSIKLTFASFWVNQCSLVKLNEKDQVLGRQEKQVWDDQKLEILNLKLIEVYNLHCIVFVSGLKLVKRLLEKACQARVLRALCTTLKFVSALTAYSKHKLEHYSRRTLSAIMDLLLCSLIHSSS